MYYLVHVVVVVVDEKDMEVVEVAVVVVLVVVRYFRLLLVVVEMLVTTNLLLLLVPLVCPVLAILPHLDAGYQELSLEICLAQPLEERDKWSKRIDSLL